MDLATVSSYQCACVRAVRTEESLCWAVYSSIIELEAATHSTARHNQADGMAGMAGMAGTHSANPVCNAHGARDEDRNLVYLAEDHCPIKNMAAQTQADKLTLNGS